MAEPGSDLLRSAMERADGWFMCRVGFVETVRAVGLAGGPKATQAVNNEWPSLGVVEVDQRLAEDAATLAVTHDLRSLDALHLAAALVLPGDDLLVATWDGRLHTAATASQLRALPEALG